MTEDPRRPCSFAPRCLPAKANSNWRQNLPPNRCRITPRPRSFSPASARSKATWKQPGPSCPLPARRCPRTPTPCVCSWICNCPATILPRRSRPSTPHGNKNCSRVTSWTWPLAASVSHRTVRPTPRKFSAMFSAPANYRLRCGTMRDWAWRDPSWFSGWTRAPARCCAKDWAKRPMRGPRARACNNGSTSSANSARIRRPISARGRKKKEPAALWKLACNSRNSTSDKSARMPQSVPSTNWRAIPPSPRMTPCAPVSFWPRHESPPDKPKKPLSHSTPYLPEKRDRLLLTVLPICAAVRSRPMVRIGALMILSPPHRTKRAPRRKKP